MYKSSSNRNADASQQKICRSLLRLLKQSDLDQIRIVTLCREAGVSRNAFYRNFTSLEDVLAYYLDTLCVELVRELPGEVFSEQYISAFFRFWLEHREALELFFRSHQMELFLVRVSQVIEQTSRLPESHRDHTPIKGMVFLASGLTGMLYFWINGRYELDPDQVARWMMENIRYGTRPEPLPEDGSR